VLAIAALATAAAAAVNALLVRDAQLALLSMLIAAAVVYARYVDRQAQRAASHLAASLLAVTALEASRPALGPLDGVAAAAVFAYTVYVAYVTYSYMWGVLKKYRFRGRR
jgi:hypothetical protein